MLKRASTSLQDMFEPILFLQTWQQAPVGKIMVEWSDMVQEMLEVNHTCIIQSPNTSLATRNQSEKAPAIGLKNGPDTHTVGGGNLGMG